MLLGGGKQVLTVFLIRPTVILIEREGADEVLLVPALLSFYDMGEVSVSAYPDFTIHRDHIA
jgi:hypothetical protein